MQKRIYKKSKENKGWFKKGQNLGNQNGFQKGHQFTKGRPAPWARNNPQIFKKGQKAWNKGITKIRERNCFQCSKHFLPNNSKDKMKFCSIECYRFFNRGQHNSNYKGGISPINNKIRGSLEYKLWQD